MLSDTDIKRAIENKEIEITPYDESCVGPASYDVHLGSTLLVPTYHNETITTALKIDLSIETTPMLEIELPNYTSDERYYLGSGQVALGSLMQDVRLYSRSIACDIAGNSSLARAFVMAHVIAGFVDPGWQRYLTLELVNLGPWAIRLWAGMRVAQLRFYRTESAVTTMYGERGKRSHYFFDSGPQASRYHLSPVTMGSSKYEQ